MRYFYLEKCEKIILYIIGFGIPIAIVITEFIM